MDNTEISFVTLSANEEWEPTKEIAFIPVGWERTLCQLWVDRKTGAMQWRKLRMVEANIGQTYHYGFNFHELTQ